MRDPYQVLGVDRAATPDAIKKRYRQLVKELHPDLNPGDTIVEQRFKEVSSAYDLLSDPDKRAKFDRGEIDAEGNPRGFHGGGFRRNARARGSAGFNTSDIFEDLFGRGGFKTKGADVSYTLTVSFLEAARGTTKRMGLSDGRSIEVKVPPGTEDGQTLRLKGQGLSGMGGGPAGDAMVQVLVDPHPHFTRSDTTIHLDVPITLKEAVLGAKIEVPTIDGRVSVSVPPGANTGTTLRLRGKGLINRRTAQRGDQLVRLKLVLPEPMDPELKRFVEKWQPHHPVDPRHKAGLV